MNTAVERMWKARKKMCIGYDNAFGLLMLGWRVIKKTTWGNPTKVILTIQSPDKKEWKRLYSPTYIKLRRRDILERVEEMGTVEAHVVVYRLAKGA